MMGEVLRRADYVVVAMAGDSGHEGHDWQ